MIKPLALAALLSTAALASPGPQPAPLPPPIPAPRDIAFPGTIELRVDATDTDRRIFRIHERVPVSAAGDFVLLYPQWLPGEHGPRGPIDKLAGLLVSSGGKRLEWRRDPVNVFAFHIDVPAGATALDLEFQYLSATDARQGRTEITPVMVDLPWSSMALYPAGYFTRDIQIAASLTLPTGWQLGTALTTASTVGATTNFMPVPFDVLVDSPVYAGRNFRRVELSTSPVPVYLDIVADRPEQLLATDAQLDAHRALVAQAYKLYGSHHYDHYDLLLSLSEHLGGQGLEHHRSSENGTVANYFTEWDKTVAARQLMTHEFSHSWNGKFRRGADLWTPDYRTPMQDSLLWVYEGQTQFWGHVLEARSGLSTKQQVLDKLALIAANLDNLPGREWRPLVDTTNDPIMSGRRPQPWSSYQRAEDYYNEGLLVWTEADSILREKSGGKRSMDDFAHAFFGINDGDFGEVTYTLNDVVRTLNTIVPYNWAQFLRSRVYEINGKAPLAGFIKSGYRLDYTDTPTPAAKAIFKARKVADFSYSLGFEVAKEAKLAGVRWGFPAFQAGLVNGEQIIAVNGRAYSDEVMTEAVTTAKGGSSPISLIVKRGDDVRTYSLPYHDGLRYPRFSKVGTGDGALDKLLAPR